MDIKPFLHEHYLLLHYYEEQEACCDKCNRKIDDIAYSCGRCKFWLHKSCAEEQLPPQINSTFMFFVLDSNPVSRLSYMSILLLIFKYNLDGVASGARYIIDTKLDHGSNSSLLEETEQSNAEFPTHLSIKYVDHPHVLSYNEATEQNKSLLCNACCQEIFYRHYACEDCEYYLHETCTTLPYEVSHPLHRQHPLKLFTDIGEFPCYQCGDHSGGFFYICYPCDFKLDLKCAMTPIAPNKEGPRQIEMERLSKLCPFNQNHKLEFFNTRANLIKDLKCYACLLPIVGSAYRCRECFYTYVHESCLALVREMQHPFHPLHLLHPQIFSSMFDQQNFSWMWSVSCFACANTIDIGYGCQKCDFRLHFNCAYSLKRALKYKSHIHNLYYFGLRAEKRARA
ncbi:hypothetical protein POUND7_003971 [Theobroma cacao]